HVIGVLPPRAAVELFRDRLRRQPRKDELKLTSNDTLIQDTCKQIGYHTLSVTLLASEFDRLVIPLTDFVHDITKRLLEVHNNTKFKSLDFCLGRSIEALDDKLKMAFTLAALLDSQFHRDDFSKLIKNIFVDSIHGGEPVAYF